MSALSERLTRAFGTTDPVVVGLSVVCVLGAVLGASGASAFVAFSEGSTLKYALSIAGPVFLLFLVFTPHKLRLTAGLLFLALPFGSYAATFAGVTVPLELVLLLLSVPVAIAAVAPARRGVLSVHPAVPWLVGVLVASLALALLRGSGDADYARTLAGVVGVVVVVRAVLQVLGRRELMFMLVVSGAAQGALAVFEYFTGRVISVYSTDVASGSYGKDYFFSLGADTRRAAGAFSDPISLGNVLCLSGILGAVLLAETSLRRGLLPLLALVALNGAVVAGLVVTYSRNSWVAYVVGVLLAVVWSPRPQRRRLGLVVATGFAVVLAFTTLLGSALGARVQSIFDPTSPTVDTAEGDLTRIQLWHVAAEVARDHPVNGVGIGNLNGYLVEQVSDTTVFSHAHNTYLQIMAEAGYPAGAAVAGLLVVAVATAVRRRGTSSSAAAAGAAVVAVALMWLTDYTVRYLSVAAVVTAVVVLALHHPTAVDRTGGRHDQLDAEDPADPVEGETHSRSLNGPAAA